MRSRRKSPQLALCDGEPAAVILDIDQYKELLARLEDAEDLQALEEMRRKPLRFRSLHEFLAEQRRHVPGPS